MRKLEKLKTKLETILNSLPTASRKVQRILVVQIEELEAKIEALEMQSRAELEKAFAAAKPFTWKLEARTRRQEGKFWMSRLLGPSNDPNYRFEREFLEPASIEWGKFGMRVAKFRVTEPGYYHDSDGDYIRVFVNEQNELDYEECSRLEVDTTLGIMPGRKTGKRPVVMGVMW